MTTTVRDIREQGLGRTLRRDAWWMAPLATAVVLGAFGIYATWVAWIDRQYQWGPYLSPFYSPFFEPSWWPLSPAFLILWVPLGFRATCYYYRKAYYRAFFMDPPACAVGEARHAYKGETALFVLQNVHRFFLYLAILLVFILAYDVVLATRWPVAGVAPAGEAALGPREFGIGVGTVVMAVNVVLLGIYTFSCHSLRHLVGGRTDCYSCTTFGRTRYRLWRGVTALNEQHMLWAWTSLFSVGLTDVYIRLCAAGVITDLRLL
ncbi:MAG: succinate dehydrogenase [Gemmatimonadetes bacterium]|nr:succinate dehydrogenase [Gemmatimonadota bacterium]